MTTLEEAVVIELVAQAAEDTADAYAEAFNNASGLDQIIQGKLENAFIVFAEKLRNLKGKNDQPRQN